MPLSSVAFRVSAVTLLTESKAAIGDVHVRHTWVWEHPDELQEQNRQWDYRAGLSLTSKIRKIAPWKEQMHHLKHR
jgi:hypothetical protein